MDVPGLLHRQPFHRRRKLCAGCITVSRRFDTSYLWYSIPPANMKLPRAVNRAIRNRLRSCLMKRFALFAILFFALTATLPQSSAVADVLFESGTLGPTGVSWQDALDGLVPGSSVAVDVFSGVRFNLTQLVVTTQIGGHFFSPAGGDFFGAIVQLNGVNDFPDSGDLSTSDVLGVALLTFPVDSAEVFADLNVHLAPGWYALVFGSELFGAHGDGGMVLNNPDIGEPEYIARQTGAGWFNLIDISDAIEFKDFRFVIEGRVIPEPSSISTAIIALLALFSRRHRTTS